jgi:hypothetical protein
MSKAACKVVICSAKASALMQAAGINAPMANMDMQALLDAEMTPEQQAAAIETLNKLISVGENINAAILSA